jgi:hypothetical protein
MGMGSGMIHGKFSKKFRPVPEHPDYGTHQSRLEANQIEDCLAITYSLSNRNQWTLFNRGGQI